MNMELDCNSVYFSDTFMGLQRHAQVTLSNNSNHIVNYFWHKFPNLETDILEMERYEQVQFEITCFSFCI